jgi:hypothetical protein
VSILNFVGA